MLERRRQRSSKPNLALANQLAVACKRSGLTAAVVADSEGLPVAWHGDNAACEEIAARIAPLAKLDQAYAGVLEGDLGAWAVTLATWQLGDSELVACTVGGSAPARANELHALEAGVRRILTAA